MLSFSCTWEKQQPPVAKPLFFGLGALGNGHSKSLTELGDDFVPTVLNGLTGNLLIQAEGFLCCDFREALVKPQMVIEKVPLVLIQELFHKYPQLSNARVLHRFVTVKEVSKVTVLACLECGSIQWVNLFVAIFIQTIVFII